MTEGEKQDHRERRRGAIFAGMLAAYLVWVVLSGSSQSQAIEQQRAACEGGNDARVSELRDRESELRQREALILNAQARLADDPEAAEPAAALRRALRLRDEEQDEIGSMVRAVDTPIAPGSVRRDCEAAYSKPFPWNLFD